MKNVDLTHDMTTYHILFYNMNSLKKLRPKFGGIEPELKDNGYKCVGTKEELDVIIKNDDYSKFSQQTKAINTSLLFHCFSYYEGFVEHLIVTKLKKDFLFKNKNINEYILSNVVKASSINKLYKYFEIVYCHNIRSCCPSLKDIFCLIDEFYKLRHILVHASIVKIEFDGSIGISTLKNLGAMLKKKYSTSGKVDLNFILCCNKIIDDYLDSVFSLCVEIEKYLVENKILDEKLNPHLLVNL